MQKSKRLLWQGSVEISSETPVAVIRSVVNIDGLNTGINQAAICDLPSVQTPYQRGELGTPEMHIQQPLLNRLGINRKAVLVGAPP